MLKILRVKELVQKIRDVKRLHPFAKLEKL